jgi:hypothetical protein
MKEFESELLNFLGPDSKDEHKEDYGDYTHDGLKFVSRL